MGYLDVLACLAFCPHFMRLKHYSIWTLLISSDPEVMVITVFHFEVYWLVVMIYSRGMSIGSGGAN